ncbi:MAG: hypothetical protein D6785_10840, partial [Planctomycetota bacterium]
QVVDLAGKYMEDSSLMVLAEKWKESPEEEDLGISFYQHRDNFETALWAMESLISAFYPHGRKILFSLREWIRTVDMKIFSQPDLVVFLQDLGTHEPEPVLEQEESWWLGKKDWGCYLPSEIQGLLISQALSGSLGKSDYSWFYDHLHDCSFCLEVLKSTKRGENREKKDEILKAFEASNKTVAMAAEGVLDFPTTLKSPILEDLFKKWKVEVNLSPRHEDKVFLALLSFPEGEAFSEASFLIGDKEFSLSSELKGAYVDKSLFRKVLDEEVPIFLVYRGGNIELFWS